MSLFSPAAPSSFLGVATTAHLALAALRNHRRHTPGPLSSLAAISLLLAATPWLFPSPLGLAVGLALHLAWYSACERFAPVPAVAAAGAAPARPAVRPASVAPSAGRPAASSRPSGGRPRGFVQTPVLAVIDETPDVRCFRIARPEGFDFQAGQFLTVRVRVDGRDHARCYSISSAPDTRGYLEISVKRQGLASNTLHATLRPGVPIFVRPPAGVFTYPAGDDRPLLLLAGGIGITPLLSMLRHATSVEPSRPVTLLYSAQTEDALAYRDEIDALARRHPQVRVVYAVTRATSHQGIYPGRIDDVLMQAAMPNIRDAIAMICGPQPMIDAMHGHLERIGLPKSQVRSERFEAAVAAVGADHAEPASHASDAGGAHRIRSARSGSATSAVPGQTLLEAVEAAGWPIDSLCRAGVCGTCRTRVVHGDVHCDTSALDADDRQHGYVLACVTRVLGDCTIEV